MDQICEQVREYLDRYNTTTAFANIMHSAVGYEQTTSLRAINPDDLRLILVLMTTDRTCPAAHEILDLVRKIDALYPEGADDDRRPRRWSGMFTHTSQTVALHVGDPCADNIITTRQIANISNDVDTITAILHNFRDEQRIVNKVLFEFGMPLATAGFLLSVLGLVISR